MCENVTKFITPRVVCRISQIVFLADLTVLRLIATVWKISKFSQNSYLREFCAQVSQIVFLADFAVFRLITTVWAKKYTKLISPRVLCTSSLSWFYVLRVELSWFDCFTAYYNCMKENVTKKSDLRKFCVQVSQLVFLADLTILRLNTTVWAKMSQNSYLREFCAKVSRNVFLADLTVLRLITTVWTKMSENSYFRDFCA